MSKPVIGVLALQGAFAAHKPHVEALGATYREIRKAEDCDGVSAYILPGGESSTMLRLMKVLDLEEKLREECSNKPTYGICAGAILLSKVVKNPEQRSFGLIDATITRNGYGRQLDSHNDTIDGYSVAFIRAPIIEDAGTAEVLAESDGKPVWLKQNNVMISSFHPELTPHAPSPMHKLLFDMIEAE